MYVARKPCGGMLYYDNIESTLIGFDKCGMAKQPQYALRGNAGRKSGFRGRDLKECV